MMRQLSIGTESISDSGYLPPRPLHCRESVDSLSGLTRHISERHAAIQNPDRFLAAIERENGAVIVEKLELNERGDIRTKLYLAEKLIAEALHKDKEQSRQRARQVAVVLLRT